MKFNLLRHSNQLLLPSKPTNNHITPLLRISLFDLAHVTNIVFQYSVFHLHMHSLLKTLKCTLPSRPTQPETKLTN